MNTLLIVRICVTLFMMLGVGVLSSQTPINPTKEKKKEDNSIHLKISYTTEVETDQTYTFDGSYDFSKLGRIDEYLTDKLGKPDDVDNDDSKTWILGEDKEESFEIKIRENGLKISGSINDETINLVKEMVSDIKEEL